MGILQRSGANSLDDRAVERAEELALQSTGFEFCDLPSSVQCSIWNQAFDEARSEMEKELVRV